MLIIMKKYLFCLAALTLGMTACENYFDEKYLDNGNPTVTVVETHEYTLISSDYASIANNKANKKYAADQDSIEGKDIYAKALEQVGKNGYFNEIATADQYVPAFIYNKYPQLDAGSVFNVTYRLYEGTPDYLEPYNAAEQHKLTASDYLTIWGNTDTKYLTPATLSRIGEVLPWYPDDIEEDVILGVVYDYSSKEPEEGGAVEETREVIYVFDGSSWKPFVATSPLILLLPKEAESQVEKWLSVTYPLATKDQTVAIMTYNSKRKLYDAIEYVYNGEAWVANTGIIEESMTFVLKEGWAANLSTYYKQAVAGDGNMGKLKLHHYNLEDGITYIWAFDNLYGMKGTAYKSGPHYGEGWFVTPAIKLKNSTSPALSFDHAMNYGPTPEDGRYEQATVWISTDYTDDAQSATWTQLPWNEWDNEKGTGFPDANSWTFYNSGRMDLSAWNNQTIYIGFRYKSLPGQTCSTWEVKNILVSEPEE